MIKVGQVHYEKPVMIIYNPSSGKKRNIKKKIAKALDEAQIKHEMYVTK